MTKKNWNCAYFSLENNNWRWHSYGWKLKLMKRTFTIWIQNLTYIWAGNNEFCINLLVWITIVVFYTHFSQRDIFLLFKACPKSSLSNFLIFNFFFKNVKMYTDYEWQYNNTQINVHFNFYYDNLILLNISKNTHTHTHTNFASYIPFSKPRKQRVKNLMWQAWHGTKLENP